MNPVLAKWYAAHSAVRRLWALRESQGVRVVVTLEPTRDGDDIYPAWLANGRDWARELQLGLGEPVQLEVMHGSSPAEWAAGADGVLVAELSWRDPGSDDAYMSGVALRPLPATTPTSLDRKLEP
jgi:hypothetical protein